MFRNLTGWHALVILSIVLLVFGAAKLPVLARSLGQSLRILKDEASDLTAADQAADSRAATGPPVEHATS